MAIKPIILQRRLAEVGRIRIGQVVPTKNGKVRPAKLDRLRFTSASKELVEKVAAAYGGEVAEWTPQGGGAQQWEVITTTSRVPVVIPPQAVTQFMELWSGGGVQRRCDGETELRSDSPCICAAEDRMLCKPTTRLSVMLRDIEGLGVWRLESKGWNAAAELPGTADFLAQHGGYIPAFLYLKAVRQVTDGETRDFMVPALAVEGWTPGQAIAGTAPTATPAVESEPERKAIEPGPSSSNGNGERLPTLADIKAATTRDAVVNIWKFLKSHDALTDELDGACADRVAELQAPPPPPATERSEEEVWRDILTKAGELGWGETQLHEEFMRANGGVVASAASAGEMAAFLTQLEARSAA